MAILFFTDFWEPFSPWSNYYNLFGVIRKEAASLDISLPLGVFSDVWFTRELSDFLLTFAEALECRYSRNGLMFFTRWELLLILRFKTVWTRLSYSFPKPNKVSLVLPTELLYFMALSVSLTGFKELEKALAVPPTSFFVLLVDFCPHAVDDLRDRLEFLDESVLYLSSFLFLTLSRMS